MEQHWESFGQRLLALRSDRRVAAALCGCVALAAAVAWWRSGTAAPPPPPVAVAPSTVPAPASGSTTTTPGLVVHVLGAVRAPGVVRLPGGARVVDAIEAAGGPSGRADLARLNLAAPVADGARVAVPEHGQPPPPLDPAAVTGGGSGSGGGAGGGAGASTGAEATRVPVNLNHASAVELESLPGIGTATAEAIVRDRDEHGPFASVDDLARVRGIGPAKLEQLRALVTV